MTLAGEIQAVPLQKVDHWPKQMMFRGVWVPQHANMTIQRVQCVEDCPINRDPACE